MLRAFPVASVILGLSLLALGGTLYRAPGPEAVSSDGKVNPSGSRTPVVVELFTSEGCSSCPPADALLARLDAKQPVAAAEVIALEQHVDYWNQLGWADPFSSQQRTRRQQEYADSFGNDSVYTPQMVVDGKVQFVGSREGQARQAILEAALQPKTPVDLRAEQNGASPGKLVLNARVPKLAGAPSDDSVEVYLAITESRLHSDVTRGENAGKALDHVGVVRELKRIGVAEAKADPAFSRTETITLGSGWKRENLRAVLFLQEKRSRRVIGAASIPLV